MDQVLGCDAGWENVNYVCKKVAKKNWFVGEDIKKLSVRSEN